MNKNRKGFTIVELVIVIAVIAILAAVLIPTFASLIAKANISADTQLVKNLNTALLTEKAGGENNKTMYDALQMAKNAGYDIDTIVSKSGNNIAWDSVNDRFVLIDSEKNTFIYPTDSGANAQNIGTGDAVKYFVIYKELPEKDKQTYSIYLSKDATLTDGTANVKVGFDAGENTTVTAVNYTNVTEQTVTIRTNSTNTVLTVEGEKSSVNHFGKAGNVLVTAVAKQSYHEFGEVVGNLEIVSGRLELAASANVNTVLVSSAAAGDVKVDVVSGANVGTVAPTTENAKTDVNSATTIPTEAKMDKVITPNSNFAGGLGTERSPYLVATAEQFAKVSAASGDGVYFKQIADIAINKNIGSFAGTYDGGDYKITYDGVGDCLYIFYDIKGYSVFKNIRVVMGKTGVSLLCVADWNTAYGATFDHITFESTESLVKVNTNNFGFIIINALYTGGNKDATPVYTFSNITNNVNMLQNEGTCTRFIVGSGPYFDVKTTVNYENCVNNGTIIGTSNVGFLYGNPAYNDHSKSNIEINVSNCKNSKVIMAYNDNATVALAPKYSELNEKYQDNVGGSFIVYNYLKDKTFTINQNGAEFSINTTDRNVSYKLAFNVSAIYTKKDGKAWTDEDTKITTDEKKRDTIWYVSNGTKYLIDLPVNVDATGDLSTSFKAYDKKTASSKGITATDFKDGYALVVKDGVTYLVFDVAENVYIDCNVQLIVYAYDAIGVIKGTANIK